jgi:hypothetical protein
MLRTIWNRQTGEPMVRDTVDAREILERSPDLYTDVDPSAEADPIVPANVSAMDEYRREPVGENPSEPVRTVSILRNATGTPRPAQGVAAAHDHFVRPKPAVTGLRGNQ